MSDQPQPVADAVDNATALAARAAKLEMDLRAAEANALRLTRAMHRGFERELRAERRRTRQAEARATKAERQTARARRRAEAAERRLAEITGSTTWRVGRVFTALPGRLRRSGS